MFHLYSSEPPSEADLAFVASYQRDNKHYIKADEHEELSSLRSENKELIEVLKELSFVCETVWAGKIVGKPARIKALSLLQKHQPNKVKEV
jgi:hypothetical protein